jgi:hypothetical protein
MYFSAIFASLVSNEDKTYYRRWLYVSGGVNFVANYRAVLSHICV